MKKIFLVLLVLAMIGQMTFAAAGQQGGGAADGLGDYPNKPIRCIVPFGPGGGTDVFVRTVLKYTTTKQPIAVVNIEGASGLVGAMEGYNAAPDGYTIIAHMPVDLIAFELSKQSNVPLWSELQTICWAVSDYNGFFTNKEAPFKTAQEMIAYAKANPGRVSWGTVGARTLNSVNTTRIIEQLGLKDVVNMVPYDGGAQIRTALQGNHIQISSNSIGDYRAILESGDAIALAIIGKERTQLMPNVPTTIEIGIRDVSTPVPRGFYAPKGMSRAQIQYLSDAFKAAVENPACVRELATMLIDAKFVDAETGTREAVNIYNDLKPFFANF